MAREVRLGAGDLRPHGAAPRRPGRGPHQRRRARDGGRRPAACSRTEGAGTGNVFFHHHPTNDAWCRDHGPIFVQRSRGTGREEAILDWGYNAWGGKYPPYDLDDVIPTRIGREFGIPVYHPGMVLEGGSIDVNGRGTLLTTEACLLNPNRNPAARPRGHRGAPARVPRRQQHPLAGRRDRRRRHRRPRGRPHPLRGPDHRRHRGRGRPRRRKLRAAPGEPGTAPRHARSGRTPLRVVTLPMPRADLPRRPTAAGQLRQLLHRQRPGPAADLRPRPRRGGP